MKKHKRIFILGMSLVVFSSGAYPLSADQHGQGRPVSGTQTGLQDSGMHQGMRDTHQAMRDSQMQKGRLQSSRGEAPVFIGPGSLSRIQQKLSEQGYDAGKADGVWGSSTAQALRRFQESRGLAPTGNFNIETLQALDPADLFSGDPMQQGSKKRQFAKSQGAPLFIGPSDLRRVQQNLHKKGFEVGAADGIWGTKTQQAIRQFQQEKGLAPTGSINLALLENLGLKHVVAALTTSISARGMASGQQTGQTGQVESGQSEAHGYFGQDQSTQQGQTGGMQNQKQATGPGAPLFAGPETLRKIQQALRESGHAPGNTDGKWNRSTQRAISEFQKEQNIETTGSLTIDTIQKLMGGFDRQTAPGENSQKSPGRNSQQTPGMDSRKSPGMGSSPGTTGQ